MKCGTLLTLVLTCFALPCKASDLGFLGGVNDFNGAQTEFSTPGGFSCRHTAAEKPSLTLGAGVSRPLYSPGFETEELVVLPKTEPVPLAGIMLRIPFGGSGNNCDELISIELQVVKLRQAQEMYELGLIDDEQLTEVSDKLFEVISQ